ncbi:MAG: hypothetical protein ACE5E4_13590, partial [Candidatus Binatia bacterium]
TYGVTQRATAAHSLVQTPDGGFLAIGHSDVEGPREAPFLSGEVYVFKTDGDGHILWRGFFGQGGAMGRSVQVTRSGAYIAAGVQSFCREGETIAIYRHRGNTFVEFRHEGVNLLGGFSGSDNKTNHGGSKKGHGGGYPFGWLDSKGRRQEWAGFWAGYAYLDRRWGFWEGVPGNPFAEQSHELRRVRPDCIELHVVTKVGPLKNPLFQCNVYYYVSPAGIGVKSAVKVLRRLEPVGFDDTGGQLIMTQIDCDLDPSKPYTRKGQMSLYYRLALDKELLRLRNGVSARSRPPSVRCLRLKNWCRAVSRLRSNSPGPYSFAATTLKLAPRFFGPLPGNPISILLAFSSPSSIRRRRITPRLSTRPGWLPGPKRESPRSVPSGHGRAPGNAETP